MIIYSRRSTMKKWLSVFGITLSVALCCALALADAKEPATPGRTDSSANLLRNSSFKIRSNPDLPDFWGMSPYFFAKLPDWDSGKYFSYVDDPSSPVPEAKVLKLVGVPSLWTTDYLKNIPGKYAFSVWARSDDPDAKLTFGHVFMGRPRFDPRGPAGEGMEAPLFHL